MIWRAADASRMRHPSGPVPCPPSKIIYSCPAPPGPVTLFMRCLHVLWKQRILWVIADRHPVVWFVAVVSGRRLGRIVNRLSAVNAHRMSRLVSLVALDPQPLPCRAPSGIAHSYLHNKSGPLKARGAMTYIALSACAERAPPRWRRRRPWIKENKMSLLLLV